MLIFPVTAFSQEICDNAIDDDGDGLIDLNDIADCQCDTAVISIPSLIPNPSFEAMNCCPSSFSQLNCAQDWIQASSATSDYMNTCGYVFPAATAAGLVPFPDGNGIVGTIFNDGWQEYVGSCLLQPMLAGQSYIIQMQIASTPVTGSAGVCNGGVVNYGPIDIIIYGSTSCANLPFTGTGCPPGSWQILGSTNYTPVNSWGTLFINFTPPVDIAAIVIGSPCSLPAGYNQPGGCYPYFYYDNLLLNQEVLFNSISQTGSWCANNIQLTTPSIPGATYQWYLDGIALLGETGLTLDVSSGGYGVGNYSIVSSDSNICAVANDSVVPPVLPTVNFSVPGVCFGSPSVFTDNSTVVSGSITAWQWDFGDGNTSTQQNPFNVYAAAGLYNVTLLVTNDSSCIDSISKMIAVHYLPLANFNFTTACPNDTTVFNDTSLISSGSIVAWQWDFGDITSGDTSILQNPTYVFNTTDTFIVTLTVTSDSGCTSIVGYSVVPSPLPVAGFTTTNVCLYDSAVFTNASTISSGSVTSWQWDFGDGNTSSASYPTHLYNADSTYDVTLIVASNNGCLDTIVQSIEIYPVPAAEFSTNDVCLYDPAVFSDTSTISSGNIVSWNWDFGDGNSTTQNPTHLYSTDGTYYVSLIVTTNNGCVDTVIDTLMIFPIPSPGFTTSNTCMYDAAMFTDGTTINAPDSIVFWQWDFGDGPPAGGSTFQNPSYNYGSDGLYNVQLIVTSNNSCIDSIELAIEIYPLPDANFISDIASGCEPLCVNFSDLTIITPGTISFWDWDFGDGSTSNEQNPENCYTAIDVNTTRVSTVTLITTSSNGCLDTLTLVNFITTWPNPIAEFTAEPQPTTILNPVINFTDQSQGDTISWSWDFGLASGETDTIQHPVHEYSDTGTYIVEQIIVNQFLCTDTFYRTIIIQPGYIFHVPNAFTPNDDAINETFISQGIGIDEENFEMYIYDRWGDEIFKTTDLFQGWDGTANNGRTIAQQDVYIWVIFTRDMRGARHKYIGRVTLIR